MHDFPVFDNFAQSQQHFAASHDAVTPSFRNFAKRFTSLPGGVETLIQGPGILVEDDGSGGRANVRMQGKFTSEALDPITGWKDRLACTVYI